MASGGGSPIVAKDYYWDEMPDDEVDDEVAKEKQMPDDEVDDEVAKEKPNYNWDEMSDEAIFDSDPVPRRAFWDPDDPATWQDFKDVQDWEIRELLRVTPPWADKIFKVKVKAGEKIYYYRVFELYSITVTDLRNQPNFNMILIQAGSTGYLPLLIYKKSGGKPIPVNHPLPLRGPHLIVDGEDHVIISLTNPFCGSWNLYCEEPRPDEYDVPVSRVFEDAVSHSKAEASFEFIQKAAKATLLFQFIPPPHQRKGCSIRILAGTIFATHGKKPNTKRIVKKFDKMPPVVVVPKTDNSNNDMLVLPVDRHVFGVPKGSSLQVAASDLLCEEQGSCFRISGTLTFPVPTHTASDVQFFTTNDDSKKSLLRLTVFWSHGY